jgi:protein phosphatase
MALSSKRRITVDGEMLDLHVLISMVESSVSWWKESLTSDDAATRAHAAEALEKLSKILLSLSRQVAQGRNTVRITSRLPTMRLYDVACPSCGTGNRDGARFCLRCGTALIGKVTPVVRKPPPLRLRIAAQTDQGRVRRNNQDTIFAGKLTLPNSGEAHLFLVADGMGGARAGEEASRVAAGTLKTQIERDLQHQLPGNDSEWQTLLRKAALSANTRVYDQAQSNTSQRGMGTTLTVALIAGDRMHIAQVGDSRAYLFNQRGVTDDGRTSAQLTTDHTLVARLVEIGQMTAEEARKAPIGNVLYRAIGTDPTVEVDTRSDQLEPGDVLLLCSDGLDRYVPDAELTRLVLEQEDPQRAAQRLIALANERGGQDNISVVIVRIEGS